MERKHKIIVLSSILVVIAVIGILSVMNGDKNAVGRAFNSFIPASVNDINTYTYSGIEKVLIIDYNVNRGDADSCEITDLANGELTQACSCVAGSCAAKIMPTSTEAVTGKVTVTRDGSKSNVGDILIEVKTR